MLKNSGIVGLAFFGCCLFARAQSSDLAKQIIALENRFSDALVQADWKAIEEIEADDLLFTTADGLVSHKSDDVDSLRSSDTKFESIEMSDVRVRNFGDVAVATGRLIERGRYKAADISGTYRFTDVWEKRSGKW